MQSSTFLSAGFLALAMTGWVAVAKADSMEATCEVRKDGEKQKGKSGPCTFGQRQGYIDIDLKNGDTLSLKPTGSANHYKDHNGNKVVRRIAGGNRQEFNWEGGKRVIVTFATSSYHGASGYNQGGGNYNNKSSYSGSDYSINRLSNGGFEVVWAQKSCIATFNSRGEAMNYSKGCNDNLISKSQDIARRER
jgi:hypothetical protein